MAGIIVNNDMYIKGRLSFKRMKIENENGEKEILTQGILATHKYLEQIDSLETLRYTIIGIDVIEESFGSDDFDIIYSFNAKDIEIKDGVSIYTEEEIEFRESKIYDEDGEIIID